MVIKKAEPSEGAPTGDFLGVGVAVEAYVGGNS